MIKVFSSKNESDYTEIISWITINLGIKKNFFLTGDLGAGKTTFVRYFSEELKTNQRVTSPSFSIMNIYDYPHGKIYHLDLYRLNTEEEAFEIGLEEILEEKETKFIEWADKFPFFFKNGFQIEFHLNEDFSRDIRIKKIV